MIYHSLVGTYLLYACQLWGQNNKETQNQFRTLQNRALRKLAFKNLYKSAGPLCKNLKIINFEDLLWLNNCLFICQLGQNKKLAATFPGLVYTKEKHNCNTRSARKNFLDTPFCLTFTYRMQSCRYQCIKDWNRFIKENSTENLTYPVVQNIFKKNVLDCY